MCLWMKSVMCQHSTSLSCTQRFVTKSLKVAAAVFFLIVSDSKYFFVGCLKGDIYLLFGKLVLHKKKYLLMDLIVPVVSSDILRTGRILWFGQCVNNLMIQRRLSIQRAMLPQTHCLEATLSLPWSKSSQAWAPSISYWCRVDLIAPWSHYNIR